MREERMASLIMASLLVIAMIYFVVNPPQAGSITLPIIRFLAALCGALSAFLFLGSLDVETHLPKVIIKGSGAFAVFIVIFFLFLHDIPLSPVIPKTKDQQINEIANRIFHKRNPQLHGREIQAHETNLKVEWNQIRRCDAVVDYIFYQRNPSMQGIEIGENQTDLRNEWLSIRDTVSGCS
ncbi:MAG: hypothetical protein WCP16_25605 [Pseudanabaena sp. ELA645]|jgi:hypothetical protein